MLGFTACSSVAKKGPAADGRPEGYNALCFEDETDSFKYYESIKMLPGEKTHFTIVKDQDACIYESVKPSEIKVDRQISFACFIDPYYSFVMGGEDFSLVKEIDEKFIQIYNNQTHKLVIINKGFCQINDQQDTTQTK